MRACGLGEADGAEAIEAAADERPSGWQLHDGDDAAGDDGVAVAAAGVGGDVTVAWNRRF